MYIACAPNSAKFRGGCEGPAKIRQREPTPPLLDKNLLKIRIRGVDRCSTPPPHPKFRGVATPRPTPPPVWRPWYIVYAVQLYMGTYF